MNNSFTYFIFYLLQMTWGIIQNILGFLIWLFLMIKDRNRKVFRYKGAIVTMWRSRTSSSLGIFIFLSTEDERVLVHEYGHCIQSCILGPLYLPVIGIPSFLWCNLPLFRKLRRKGTYRYSSLYAEKWANHLGEKITHRKSIRY